MSTELLVPSVGESITRVVVGEWLKPEGAWVDQDETVVVLETDKVNVEVPAPVAGTLSRVAKRRGDAAGVGEVLGWLDESAARPASAWASPIQLPAPPAQAPSQPALTPSGEVRIMPAAERALAEAGLKASQITPTGPGGRLLKEDVVRAQAAAGPPTQEPAPPAPPTAPERFSAPAAGPRAEEAVPMTPLRQTVAERLLHSQNNMALLTTFNEVDMTAVMDLRARHQEAFTAKYGIKLGFMSFFVKACIEALKAFPAVNAEIRGQDIVFKHYYDIGVAVGGGKGLVVPVIRGAERLSFAQVEQAVADFGARARSGKLKLEELQGGTFTISNGGVYGSLLSTPIVNPPQSGVLGMHKIQERPVALGGQVVIRPMMYLALTYDHRLVDGREAVSFLVRIKECLEEPARMLIEL